MRTGGWIALAVAMLLSMPAAAVPAEGAFFERHVERLVARPTPIGPITLYSDEASWSVRVPEHAVVLVEAIGNRTEPFVLRVGMEGAAEDSLILPTTHAGFALHTPGDWRVRVDPLAGVAVDIVVRFRGHVSDDAGAPAVFTLDEAQPRLYCVLGSVCLP